MPGDQAILKDWHEFYLLTGTAAARVYMSPVVFHFTSILFLSLVTLVPPTAHLPPGALIGVNGGIARSLQPSSSGGS